MFMTVKKNRLKILLCILLFSHCKRPAGTVPLDYDEYDNKNALLKKNAAMQKFKSSKDGEFQLTITGPNYYKKTLAIKEIVGRIYWKCDDKFMLSHSIYPVDKTGTCFSD